MSYEVVSRETFKDSRNRFVIRYLVKVGEFTYESAHQLDQKNWEKFSPEEQDDFLLSIVKKHHEKSPTNQCGERGSYVTSNESTN